MNEHTGQVRMSDKTGDPQADPDVVWRCPKSHLLLRVYRTRNGWHVLGQSFRVPPKDWLERADSGWTVDDIREGRVEPLNLRRVRGVDQMLELDINTWPFTGKPFEVGCRCNAVKVPLEWLADDCRRALDEHRTIERTIG